MMQNNQKIVVIGGGFGGVNFIRNLSSSQFEITLVDRNNYNFFPPLIYQIATAVLEPSSIIYPYRKLFRSQKNVKFRMGEFIEVKTDERKVVLSNGELSYDILVFSTGLISNFFGLKSLSENAIPMKTLEDALNMRNMLLLRMEQASIAKFNEEQSSLLTITVAGGGPTGVEIAGMLAELKNGKVQKEYPEFSSLTGQIKIILVDGGGTLLQPMSKKSQKYTYESLVKLGVDVRLNVQVLDFDGEVISLNDQTKILTRNLIWAAGVTGKKIVGMPEEVYGRGNRIIVSDTNRVKGFKNIYAIGDISLIQSAEYPNGHPQLAQVAIQQGKLLARNIKNVMLNLEQIKFRYKEKGSMAIIGKNKAVADLPFNLHLKGFLGWITWVFIHLISLINYRNRLRTLYNWCVAYFTKDQSLRFIIRPNSKVK